MSRSTEFYYEEPRSPLRVKITKPDGATCGFEGVRPDTAMAIRIDMRAGYTEGTVVSHGMVLDWERIDDSQENSL